MRRYEGDGVLVFHRFSRHMQWKKRTISAPELVCVCVNQQHVKERCFTFTSLYHTLPPASPSPTSSLLTLYHISPPQPSSLPYIPFPLTNTHTHTCMHTHTHTHTHSHTRQGIMNFGRLCCLGTQTRLKTRFGTGYELQFHCVPGKARNVETFVEANLPMATHTETYAGY